MTLTIADHPLLDPGVFVTRFDHPLGELASPAWGSEAVPLTTDDRIKTAVRDLLRHGGFKPAGRSKPASEYLLGTELPRINAAVDVCNLVSRHSGLPISVVDLDLLDGELTIEVAPAGTSYVFNPSGQTIDASGLLCVYDRQGPTGTPVKDAQRTKTSATTRATLSVVWGTRALPGRTQAATRWYRELLGRLPGVTLTDA